MPKKAKPTVSYEFTIERAKVCSLGCHMGVAEANRPALKALADARTDDWIALQLAWLQLARYATSQAQRVVERL